MYTCTTTVGKFRADQEKQESVKAVVAMKYMTLYIFFLFVISFGLQC